MHGRNILIWGLLGMLALSGCNQRQNEITETGGAESGSAWITDFDTALKQAKGQGKPVLVDFFATWCGPCKLMDRKTFSDPAVVNELTNWIAVKIDVDQQQELARKFDVQAMPTTILLNPEGQVINSKVGYINPSELLSFAEAGRRTIGK